LGSDFGLMFSDITDESVKKHGLKVFQIVSILFMIFSVPITSFDLPHPIFAEESPVKIIHDGSGEVWQLSSNEFLAKFGGETTKRVFDESTNTWKSNIVTDNGNGNFDVVSGLISTKFVDDKIFHYNDTMSQVAEDKLHVMKKVGSEYVEIPLTFVSRTSQLLQTNVDETVGSYNVVDVIETARITETWASDDVDVLIYYDFKEGEPLKHTFIPTPKIDGIFRLYHTFTIDGNDVNIKSIATESSKTESYDIDIDDISGIDVKKDGISKDTLVKDSSKVFTDKDGKETTSTETTLVKSDESDVIRYVEVSKSDGTFLFGEFVSPSKGNIAWQKFIELNIIKSDDVTFEYRYGDWIVSSGETFELDPDTFTTNAGTDNKVSSVTQTGASCSNTALAITDSADNTMIAPDSDLNQSCFRSYMEWPITTISDSATIQDVDITFDIAFSVNPVNCDITENHLQLSLSSTPQTVWDDIGNGTAYVSNNSFCNIAGDNTSVDLGSSADAKMRSMLTNGDYFGVGFKLTSEARDSGVIHSIIIEDRESTGTPDPTLEVMYTTKIPSAPLNPSLLTTSSTQITFDWDAPANGDNITGYKIWNGTDDSVLVNNTGSVTTSYDLTGLTSGKFQKFYVSAWNATGYGLSSSTASNYTRTSAPVLDKVNVYNSTAFELFFTINGTFNGIKIDGEIPDNNGFTTLLSNSSSSASSYVLTGIESASDYNIKIYAHNLGGTSTASNEITNATAITNAPVLTSVSQTLLASTLLASWNEPTSGNATTYNIFRSIVGCSSMISAGNSSTTSFIITGLNASSTYCVEVKSVNAYGSSSSSNQIIGLTIDEDVYVPPATTGGGGSSGGGSSPDTGVVINGLLLNLSSKSFNLSLGEKRTYALNLVWDETKESTLFVKSVNINSIGLDSLSVIPEVIPVDGKKITKGNGEIIFDINVPTEKCGTIQQTARCVNLKTYTIPVMVTVSDLIGTSYPDIPAVITVIINDKFPIGLAIVVILLLAVSYPIAKIISKNSKQSSRKSPKQMQKDHQKALKKSEKDERKKAKHDMNMFKKIKREF
jgi:hypothetical protein